MFNFVDHDVTEVFVTKVVEGTLRTDKLLVYDHI
jgi:hypothetical protein